MLAKPIVPPEMRGLDHEVLSADPSRGLVFGRRSILRSLGAVGLAAALPTPARTALQAYRLVVQEAMAPLVDSEGPATKVWAFNGQVPGPVIRARQGERLRVEVENRLAEPTTVHWHGLRVPAAMDGVPWLSQTPIAPGETFVYDFELKDAGTYWYHPHINSSEQVGRGLHGVLIVEEAETYPVDREVLWTLDDWRLDREARIAPFGAMMDKSHAGRFGNTVTVNGSIAIEEAARAGERLRLRLVNVANARVFSMYIEDLPHWVIAYDGQPIRPHRPADGRIHLGPGMRADVVIDMAAEPGSVHRVIDDAYGRDNAYEVMRFVVGEGNQQGSFGGTPPALPVNPIARPSLDQAVRKRVVFEGGAMGGLSGAHLDGRFVSMRDLAQAGKLWAMNGTVPQDIFTAPPLFDLALGQSYVVELVNKTAFDHPIHLHGHVFEVLSRNDQPIEPRPLGDSVLLRRQERAEIAFVADNPGAWMFHCHILEHQESGMMATVKVA